MSIYLSCARTNPQCPRKLQLNSTKTYHLKDTDIGDDIMPGTETIDEQVHKYITDNYSPIYAGLKHI